MGPSLLDVFLCLAGFLSLVPNPLLCSLLSAVPLAAFVTRTHSSCLQRQSDKLNRESCSLGASLSVCEYICLCICTYVSINILIAFNVNILVPFLSTMSQYLTKRQHREERFLFGSV